MRRIVHAALLLYPRTVRRHHGAELGCLVEDLIEHDGASRPAVVARLAYDGLIQRLMSRTTAWAAAITLTVTMIGSLAVSDLAAASARQRVEPRAHAAAPATHLAPAATHSAPATHGAAIQASRGAHRAGRRPAGIIAR